MSPPCKVLAELGADGTRWLLCETCDGSPTLLRGPLEAEVDAIEPMHNLRGALGETIHVYGPALSLAFDLKVEALKGSVVGLGLGTIEMVWVAMLPADHLKRLRLQSFEADQTLRSAFLNWLGDGPQHHFWQQSFDATLRATSATLGQTCADLKQSLVALYQGGSWRIDGPLDANAKVLAWNLMAFDAYSEATSPALWSETIVSLVLGAAATDGAVLATYAAKSALKRGLMREGFRLHRRGGFGGKRECTLASRIKL